MNINPPLTDQLPSLLALPTAARAKRYDVTDQRRTLSLDYRGPASAGSRGTLRMNGAGERKRERQRQRQRETERHTWGCAAESGKSLFFTVAFIL